MKSKYWVLLLGAVLLVSAALSLWLLLPKGAAQYAEIWSEGKLIQTVNLNVDTTLEVMMLKLKLQYYGHLMRRVDSLEKTLMLGRIGGRRRRG